MGFLTAVDHADRVVVPLSPLPCQAWHGYGVSNAHHGEARECRRASAPLSAAATPAGAASTS
jgi:hypothetical protein